MPPPLDPRMMRVLGQVTISGDEGISIKKLFDEINNGPSAGALDLDTEGKSVLWGEILLRDDLLIGNEKGHQAMVKKNLCLQDVFDFGLQERKITIRRPDGSSPQTVEATRFSEPTPTPSFHTAEASSPDSSAEEAAKEGAEPIMVQSRDHTHIPQKPILNTEDATQESQDSGTDPHSQRTSARRGRKPSKKFDPSGDLPVPNTPTRSQATRKSTNRSADAPASGNNQKYLRHAIFTPHEEVVREEDDIQRKAGIPRVYIDPYGSEPPRSLGRPKKQPRMIAVFKSSKLKINNWLTSHTRTWADVGSSIKEDVLTAKTRRGRKPKKVQEPQMTDKTETASIEPASGEKGTLKERFLDMQPAHQASTLSLDEMISQTPVHPLQQSQSISYQAQSADHPPHQHYLIPQKMLHPMQFHTPQHQAHVISHQRTSEQQPTPEATPQSTHLQPHHTSTPQQDAPAVVSEPQRSALGHMSNATKAPLYHSPYATDKAGNTGLSALPGMKSIKDQYQTPTQPHGFFGEPTPVATFPHPVPNSTQTNANQHARQGKIAAKGILAETNNRSVSPETYAPILPPPKIAPSTTPPSSTAILPPKSILPGSETTQNGDLKRKASMSQVIPAKRQQTTSILPPQRSLVLSSPLATSTAVRVEIPSSKPRQSLGKVEDKFEEELDIADSISISNIASISARFAAKYGDVIGNVVLRKNQANLEFLGSPSNSLLLAVPVGSFTKYPIISQKGSNPMELFVYVQDEVGVDIIYRFDFGLTPTAFNAANNARAKLSAAWLFHQKENDAGTKSAPIATDQMKKAYPFFCPNEGCGKRWKNKEGLVYHATKSNTPCSKSYNPAKVDGRKSIKKTTRMPKSKKQQRKEPKPPTSRSINHENSSQGLVADGIDENVELPEETLTADLGEGSKFTQDTPIHDIDSEKNYQSDSSTHSSVQSDLEWAWKVAQSQQKHSTKRRRRSAVDLEALEQTAQPYSGTARRPRRLSTATVDAGLLQAIINGAAGTELPLTEDLSNQASGSDSKPDARAITKEIILEIVKGNHSVFPGGRGLWYAVFATCIRRASQLRLAITIEGCSNALIMLIMEKKLKSMEIKFTDKDSELITRHVIMEPSIAFDSPTVEMMKETIQVAHPDCYVPSKFAPSEEYRAILQRLFEKQTQEPSFDDSPVTKRRRINSGSRPKARHPEGNSENELEDGEFEDWATESRQPPKGQYLPIAEATREKLSRATKRRWAAIKAGGGSDLRDLKDCVPDASPRQFAVSKVSKTGGLSAREKQRRAAKAAARREQSWHHDPPFLQSAETSAWSEVPAKVKKPPALQRRRLPEPITYLQNQEDGSWSIRPFGHGVNPIHKRPSRQAVGNPHSAAYTNRRDNGFRPVLEPIGVRKFLPGPPSKHIISSVSPAVTPRMKRDSTEGSLDGPESSIQVSKRARAERDSTSVTPEDAYSNVRISKATGKPVRGYTRVSRGHAELVETSSSRISAATSGLRRETKKPTRIGEADSGHSIEPSEFDDGIIEVDFPANPGLDSLPINFGVGSDLIGKQPAPATFDTNQVLYDRTSSVFNQPPSHPTMVVADIEGTAKWEQETGSEFFVGGKVASAVGWINHTLDSQESYNLLRNPDINWRAENTFTMETLPYHDLEGLSLLEPDVPTKPQYRISEPGASVETKKVGENDREAQKTRFTSALASKFSIISDDPMVAGKELGFNVIPNEAMSLKRQKIDAMPRKDQLRLIAVVVAVRVITGGREQVIDWVLVASLFENYALHFLSKQWASLLHAKKEVVDNFTLTFQEAFLIAYKNGELPPINFDDLQAYDWNTLIDWTLKMLNVSLQPKHFDLPDTRNSIEREYKVTEKPSKMKDRELLFKAEPAAYAKIHYLASVPLTKPVVPPQGSIPVDEMDIDEFTLAKSLVRAAAVTPEVAYDAGIARRKFELVDEAIAEEAIATLRREKIITARREGGSIPGRLYQAHAQFSLLLERKQLSLQQFAEAVEFKGFLDSEFASGKKCVRAEYMANEGTSMCLTQLQTHGRIRLQPVLASVTAPDDQYGRNASPSFQIDIYPSDSYVNDNDNEDLQNALSIEPPRGGSAGEIPSWYGITDQLIPDIWGKLIASFSGVVALRTGSTVNELTTTFKSALEEWEIRRLLKWGVEIGLFKRLHKDIEGWTVGEWWWEMVGHFAELGRNDDDVDDDDDDDVDDDDDDEDAYEDE